MPEIQLIRRGETLRSFEVEAGQSLFSELIRYYIPPSSVVALLDDRPVSIFKDISPQDTYEVRLLEGYDIQQHRQFYELDGPDDTVSRRHLTMNDRGEISQTANHLDGSSYIDSIEEVVNETAEHYELFTPDDRVLVAVSGECDSASMLLALSALESRLDIEIEPITLEEPRGSEEGAIRHARNLANDLGLDHRLIELDEIESVYGISSSIRDAFDLLTESSYRHQIITILDTVHRRMFEEVAEDEGFDRICLGSHSTEFVAGILNSITTGIDQNVGNVPKRRAGPFTYVYPVALLGKAELAIYHWHKSGELPPTSHQNMWDVVPSEQSFIYYISDILQTFWPDICTWLVEGSQDSGTLSTPDEFVRCCNCEKYILGDGGGANQCIACKAFSEVGAL